MARDVVVATAVTVFVLFITSHVEREAGERALDWLAITSAVVAGGALIFRRRWPLPVLAVVTVALVTYGAREYLGGPIYVIGAIALFSYAVTTDRRRATVTGAVVATAVYLTRVITRGEWSALGLLIFGWAAVAVLAADAVRSAGERRRYAADQREEATQRRLAEDRVNIARDLHDSVAHAMTSINVQSGVAAHLLDRDPSQAAQALEAIRVASRDVLQELGSMLEVLRRDEAARLQPVADLGQLDRLVESSEMAGLHVDMRIDGDIDAVVPAVSIAAYRIVQEALTNVARHGTTSTAHAAVEVSSDGALHVEVVNGAATDGGTASTRTASRASSAVGVARPSSPGDGQIGSGRGLDGIRERVANTGGSVEIGPGSDGRFAVHATWPRAVST